MEVSEGCEVWESSDDGEEEFCSCCGEDDGWDEAEEASSVGGVELGSYLDDSSLRMFFKGISIRQTEDSPSGLSGIGVFMERSPGTPLLRVQKKLDFHVEDSVAELLALMDGLLEALSSGVRRVFAFTDSELVCQKISEAPKLENQLLAALAQRILEHANKFEEFHLKLVPSSKTKKALLLAQEAIGVLVSLSDADKSFLLETIRCPFSSCSVLLGTRGSLVKNENSSRPVNACSVECPECQRAICLNCVVPWHVSMSCEEYQSLSADGSNSEDTLLHHIAQDNNWRHCERCGRVIELTEGCYHTTCWCGYEFCYSCGAEYRNANQTCHCMYHNNDNTEHALVNRDSEPWSWESFELPISTMDAYTEQERSQLALIQRFLAGGFGLSDQNPCPSPPRCSDSFVDTVKDLRQLPWLERFVSVISDNYHEDYRQ